MSTHWIDPDVNNPTCLQLYGMDYGEMELGWFNINNPVHLKSSDFGLSGITGILCSRFCHEVVLTDHNKEVLKILNKNIELHSSLATPSCAGLVAEKLEWGNDDDMGRIIQRYPSGFDLVLGADICFQQSSIPPLFDTVEQLLRLRGGHCKVILAYVSRAKMMDAMVVDEAIRHGMKISEVNGTRTVVRNLEGVIYEIKL